jgi:phosphonate transport system permease protein
MTPRIIDAVPRSAPRLDALIVLAVIMGLIVASFATLDLQFGALFAAGGIAKMAEFASGFAPPDLSPAFLARVMQGAAETLAMSALGSLIAAIFGLLLALPASRVQRPALRRTARLVLNVLRSIPELVWAALLVIAAGLGPFPGTLALAVHTAGVLGRLFADTLENLPPAPAEALRTNGASAVQVFLYATAPQAAPQFVSYTLYRWENNIRAATVLGVVGAGGLGQLLYVHLSWFQMDRVATVVIAMLVLVLIVDLLSYIARQRLTR